MRHNFLTRSSASSSSACRMCRRRRPVLAQMLLDRLHQHLLLHAEVFHNLLLHKRPEPVRHDTFVHVIPLHLPPPEALAVRRNLLRQRPHRPRHLLVRHARGAAGTANGARARVVVLERDQRSQSARRVLLLFVVEQALDLGNGAAARRGRTPRRLRLLRGSAQGQLEWLRRRSGRSSSSSSSSSSRIGFRLARSRRFFGLLVEERVRHAERALPLGRRAALLFLFLAPVRLVLGLLVGAVARALAGPCGVVPVVRVRLATRLALVVPLLILREAGLRAPPLRLGAVLFAVALAIQRCLPRALAARPLALRLAVQPVRARLFLVEVASMQLFVAGVRVVIAVGDAAVFDAAVDKVATTGAILGAGPGGRAAGAKGYAVGAFLRRGPGCSVASPFLLFKLFLAT
ncbi:hypothetical protein BM221_000681 [Beauveria bassiana]|uniref:Uncharacterized protein n=1 Tax=Beauveria bassiana TaxID=176275 RepID=A0A2N6P184_BEABA|nr:hypothetical protein BM221_000681 [Beauveria bassiana]